MGIQTPTPSTIGPYRVVRTLGKGGMGTVYEAIHTTIERRVAIKLLNAEYAHDHDVTARFFNEARAVNLIDHPSIVQISDFGQLPDGAAYIVMELLKGESLATRLKRTGRLSVAQSLQLTWQIAAALTASHAKGIIHRDLKPDNVMLVPDVLTDGIDRAKLLDFGIAKLAQANRTKTNTGAVMGTPQYMSPEQCKGAGEVDERTDVYSLGVMIFEMLAGCPPFEAEAPWQLIGMHLFQEPPRLSAVVPTICPDIALLISQLLVKDRTQRPTMRQVQTEIDALLSPYRSKADATRVKASAVPPPDETIGSAKHSTLGHSSGQSTFRAEKRRSRRITLIASTSLLITLMIVFTRTYFMTSQRATASPANQVSSSLAPATKPAATSFAPAVTERKVRWRIMTVPLGAEVLDASGERLGETPWQRDEPVGRGSIVVKIYKSGFEVISLSLDRNTNENRQEILTPIRRTPALRPPVSRPPIRPRAPTQSNHRYVE